ncbi:MFS transporter [Horticoccus luteus]|uniref:MFS transporter n=1 Tax=Horticoccus luteus TaxID=2862869 RepID=A0A8F9XG36_9BACT|nr:MFS transporter [Horticoccus luteus]QYM77800.1 MFS transporter [Horticoccus luteus]
MPPTATPLPPAPRIPLSEQIGRYRWTICGLVFFATTINYLDRNVLGLLKQTLSEHGVFGPDKAAQELNYSTVVICFQIAYAVGMLAAGRFIDWVGTKTGYAASLIGWSIAAIGHAFGHHTWSFGFWRAALGFSEAGNFPAANKTVAEWFPRKERAFATGLYNSGANVGAIVAPLCVPYIASAWGWEWAFILTGAVGLIWIVFWVKTYASPAAKLQSGQLSQAEYDYIHSDRDEQVVEQADAGVRISGARLLGFRQTWAFILGKFLTDPIWWFFLFWLPAFLEGENARKVDAFLATHPGFTGDHSSIPGVISWPIAVALVYTVATAGSIFGGWLPKAFINHGMTASKARKLAMFIYALLPLTVLFASRLGAINTWLAVATIAIACSAHQAWSANIFTTASDMFPKKAVASVTGLGGMAGAIGGILIARVAGKVLEHFTALGHLEAGYALLFVICGSAYLVAWLVMHALAPKFEMVDLRTR